MFGDSIDKKISFDGDLSAFSGKDERCFGKPFSSFIFAISESTSAHSFL
jgi:hypothetical protein